MKKLLTLTAVLCTVAFASQTVFAAVTAGTIRARARNITARQAKIQKIGLGVTGVSVAAGAGVALYKNADLAVKMLPTDLTDKAGILAEAVKTHAAKVMTGIASRATGENVTAYVVTGITAAVAATLAVKLSKLGLNVAVKGKNLVVSLGEAFWNTSRAKKAAIITSVVAAVAAVGADIYLGTGYTAAAMSTIGSGLSTGFGYAKSAADYVWSSLPDYGVVSKMSDAKDFVLSSVSTVASDLTGFTADKIAADAAAKEAARNTWSYKVACLFSKCV